MIQLAHVVEVGDFGCTMMLARVVVALCKINSLFCIFLSSLSSMFINIFRFSCVHVDIAPIDNLLRKVSLNVTS